MDQFHIEHCYGRVASLPGARKGEELDFESIPRLLWQVPCLAARLHKCNLHHIHYMHDNYATRMHGLCVLIIMSLLGRMNRCICNKNIKGETQ